MIVVPVIDRGPYANGASWDLTMATGEALGMYTTATIGAVPLRAVH
jgi:rare lipoprotein A (peptidoglycan hydrolase)